MSLGTTKTALLDRLDAINFVSDTETKSEYMLAEEAVKTAEYVRTQANYDKAKSLVDKLVTGSDKDILIKRLSVVKAYLDKISPGQTVPQIPGQTGTQTPGQTGLQNIEDALKNAEDKVKLAESTRSLANYDTAKSAVDALPSNSAKVIFLHRLAVVKAYLDEQSETSKYNEAINSAIDKVGRAESSRTKETYDLAKYFVDALPSSAEKSTLLNRLSVVEDYLAEKEKVDKDAGVISSATVSVSKAELNRTQANYDAAKKLVDALPESDSKRTLLNRLATIQKYLDGKNSTITPNASTTSPTGTATINPPVNPNMVIKVTNGVVKSQVQEAAEKQILATLQKHWVKTEMQNLMERNIFIWDNAQTFKPNEKVTQEEFVALLARAYETNMASVNLGVLKGKYASEIRVGLDKGFIKGTESLKKPITREEAVRMLVRALRTKANIVTPSTNLVQNYKDGSKIGVMARSDFNYALHTKLIYGDTKRNLNAQGSVTKAEAIAFVSRLLDKIPIQK
ncbi:S-layer homology domain-containing protein [Aneurinibacillus tyrosinisolvens]|uniref:S-layer homology domain-containing protein n=1 Tax=Aneurinibacillus tyrosinisolvens TaxID=1443435 RepID=UPI00128C355B|nr:S-layer homology domain-containing protein [Aneurinibacillus tyrosinisolvens]